MEAQGAPYQPIKLQHQYERHLTLDRSCDARVTIRNSSGLPHFLRSGSMLASTDLLDGSPHDPSFE